MSSRNFRVAVIAVASLSAAYFLFLSDPKLAMGPEPVRYVPSTIPDKEATAPRADTQAQKAKPSASTVYRDLPMPKKVQRGPGSVRLPDGSYLPVLNGAYGAKDPEWPRERPYSPVIRKVVDKEGLEWYLHGDGSYTITEMLYRSDLGREDPTTTVYNPVEPAKIPTAELAEEKAKSSANKAKEGNGKNSPQQP